MPAGVHGDYKALRSCNSVYKEFIVQHLLVLTQWKKKLSEQEGYIVFRHKDQAFGLQAGK